jgi:hypothetical protein
MLRTKQKRLHASVQRLQQPPACAADRRRPARCPSGRAARRRDRGRGRCRCRDHHHGDCDSGRPADFAQQVFRPKPIRPERRDKIDRPDWLANVLASLALGAGGGELANVTIDC